MPLYQGRALHARDDARPRPARGLRPVMGLLPVLTVVVALPFVPWARVLSRVAKVHDIQVEGLRYLEASAVLKATGIKVGRSLFALDPDRIRQVLLRNPRIADAHVFKRWPGLVRVRIAERTPLLVVGHGAPWEIDTAGVMLPPLAAASGAVADVPVLVGVSLEAVPAGAWVCTSKVERGIAWARAVADRELQLTGEISEIDVADSKLTRIVLMDGTRVLSSAWPPGVRTLSALRAVLADLRSHKQLAQEIDLRFKDQVIVRSLSTLEPGKES